MELNEKIQRIEDVKRLCQELIDKADKITNLFMVYDLNDEVDARGIYHSACGDLMIHYGMVCFMEKLLHDFITQGNTDYTEWENKNTPMP